MTLFEHDRKDSQLRGDKRFIVVLIGKVLRFNLYNRGLNLQVMDEQRRLYFCFLGHNRPRTERKVGVQSVRDGKNDIRFRGPVESVKFRYEGRCPGNVCDEGDRPYDNRERNGGKRIK